MADVDPPPGDVVDEAVSYGTSGFALFYGLLLGLLTVAAYQNNERVKQAILNEATALGTVYGAMASYPEPIRLPGAGNVFRSMFTSEARIRPYYSGTGAILLQPSLGGYHILDIGVGESPASTGPRRGRSRSASRASPSGRASGPGTASSPGRRR